MNALSNACTNRDYEYIAGWILGRFDVEVTPKVVSGWFTQIHRWDKAGVGGWTDGTWFMWLRNRLADKGEFGAVPSATDINEFIPTAVMHVFFLHLEETDEMLERLMYDSSYKKRASEVARSKMFPIDRMVQPIDKTALRVGGTPPKAQEE